MTAPTDDFPCNEFVEMVTDYLDGSLARDDAHRFEEHLARCGGCVSVLDQFRAVIRASGRLAPADVDALTPAQREPMLAAFRDWAATRT